MDKVSDKGNSGQPMSANSFGKRFVMMSFGESHGQALGVVVDGCPAGLRFDKDLLDKNMKRRRPGSSTLVSSRNESDQVEILSGVFEGKTLGTPIAMIVKNTDARSQDYQNLEARPGHADQVWKDKFHHVDPRGGGRSSGRETVARVMAGSVAEMLVRELCPDLRLSAVALQVGPYSLSNQEISKIRWGDKDFIDGFAARFPSVEQSASIRNLLEAAKIEGKSYGGTALLCIEGAPKGLGQPVFHKLKADLAAAYFSLGATAAVDLGEGSLAANAEGSVFHRKNLSPYGGILGGISTGERIVLKIAFKPTSSVLDVAKKGRHDPCIVPRALAVLEAMTHLVLAEHLLWARGDRI